MRIFSSFATFDYASRALKLQTSDCLLKPICKEGLITAVQKAISKYQSNWQKELHAEYWVDSQTQNTEAFWARISLGKIPPDTKSVRQEIRKRHLPENTASKQWMPVVLRCQGVERHDGWDRSLYEYGVKNILAETLYLPDEEPVIPIPEENHFLILLYTRVGQTAVGQRI